MIILYGYYINIFKSNTLILKAKRKLWTKADENSFLTIICSFIYISMKMTCSLVN